MTEDNRIQKTKSLLKHALLERLIGEDISDITVSSLCDHAGVSRTSLYKHYRNTGELLDEAMDDLLNETMNTRPAFFACLTGNRAERTVPMCVLLRNDPRFRAILGNDVMSERFCRKIEAHFDNMVRDRVADISSLSEEDMRVLFSYQISGCIAAVRRSMNESDADWDRKKRTIDSFLRRAYHLKNR